MVSPPPDLKLSCLSLKDRSSPSLSRRNRTIAVCNPASLADVADTVASLPFHVPFLSRGRIGTFDFCEPLSMAGQIFKQNYEYSLIH